MNIYQSQCCGATSVSEVDEHLTGICSSCKDHAVFTSSAEESSRREAFADYSKEKQERIRQEEIEECPHDEHDHGICLDCGKDVFDTLLDRADYFEDR
jgi:hypothetical protein